MTAIEVTVVGGPAHGEVWLMRARDDGTPPWFVEIAAPPIAWDWDAPPLEAIRTRSAIYSTRQSPDGHWEAVCHP